MHASMLISHTMKEIAELIDPATDIVINMEARFIRDMAEFLNGYHMEESVRVLLLGCYVLLRSSLQSHDLVEKEPSRLTKHVLDGDYLQSLYFDYALRHKALDLIKALANVYKTLQIRRIEGKPMDYLLAAEIQQFVMKRYVQVTYEVI